MLMGRARRRSELWANARRVLGTEAKFRAATGAIEQAVEAILNIEQTEKKAHD